jgi:hypothetical protein
MATPAGSDRVMFDARAGEPPHSRDGGESEQPGRAMAVKPYHLVPMQSTRSLCGEDITGWRVVDVPWGGFYDCKRCRAALAASADATPSSRSTPET